MPPLSRPQEWRGLIYGALESGVNVFDIQAGSEIACAGLRLALESVERRLLLLSWRISGTPGVPLGADELSASVRAGLHRTGSVYFDVLLLDETAFHQLSPDGLAFLEELKGAGLALQIGAVCSEATLDELMASPLFEVAAIPFNVTTGSQTRRHIREALQANMTLIGYDVFPASVLRPGAAGGPETSGPSPRGLTGLFRRKQAQSQASQSAYAFVHETPGWAAAEICLGYALTEPAFATLFVQALKLDSVERMAKVVDRDLPTSIAAQVEMARFRIEGAP